MTTAIPVFIGILFCLLILFFSGKSLVTISINLARKLGVSDIFIGTTLIAFTTGLPTLVVSIIAFSSNQPEIAIGNLIGTNYVNIGLALGIPAFLTTILVKKEVFEKEIPLYFSLMALFTSFILDMRISTLEGILLIVFLFAAWGIIIQYGKSHKVPQQDLELNPSKEKINKRDYLSLLLLFLAILVASFGISFLTPLLAQHTNISSYLLGLTLIGVGTSIPTITAGITAAKQGNTDIIVGNVFGGNILNICLGIGLLAMIKPMQMDSNAVNDLLFVNIYGAIIVILILAEMKFLGKNKTLSQISGLIMVLTYLGYLAISIAKYF
ncbi:MAG TPA: sodium:calcium antiporter [Candidatus Dojkabacteria bacterium]|nr:sodium:calcium antiporter [Candidatus Dojkabacteria bacterium]